DVVRRGSEEITAASGIQATTSFPFPDPSRRFHSSTAALICGLLGLLLLVGVWLNRVGQVAGFFGAGTLFLVASLCQQGSWLRRGGQDVLRQRGWWGISRLGFRNVSDRPGRSVLCIALIASAAFIIVAVEAFKRDSLQDPLNQKSGTGGYLLLAESLVPIHHD